MDRRLLHAIVEDDEDGMYQIAGKANVGKWNPETKGQKRLDKTWRNKHTQKLRHQFFPSLYWYYCILQTAVSKVQRET